MGNKKSRQFMQQQELIRAWEEAQTRQRHFSEDVGLPAIGKRIIQVIYAPSLQPGFAWDMRVETPPAVAIVSEGDSLEAENTDWLLDLTWRLFRSSVDSQSHYLVGYEELDAPSSLLQSYFGRLQNLSIPMLFPSSSAGFDGTTYQVAFFGGASTEVRIRWWSDCPTSWSAVGEIANEMIHKFLTYEPKVI